MTSSMASLAEAPCDAPKVHTRPDQDTIRVIDTAAGGVRGQELDRAFVTRHGGGL